MRRCAVIKESRRRDSLSYEHRRAIEISRQADGKCAERTEDRMEYLVNAVQMKQYDADTIGRIGIPGLVLMERAAAATAEEIRERFPIASGPADTEAGRVLVLAGCGNNGGDGFAAGRILQEYGYPVSYVLVGSRDKCSGETEAQIRILECLGVVVESRLPKKEEMNYEIIIDALFGIGLSREVTGIYKAAVDLINGSGAYVVSADIPSGIHADTGAVMGTAVRADLTVTYGYRKLGHVFYPGAEYAGTVICRRIGIAYRDGLEKPEAYTYDLSDLADMPVRRRDGNKGSFGKVLVIAGSKGMYGACQFAVLGAYRTGAGLVRVFTARENRELLLSAVPEAIVDTYGEEFPQETLDEALSWADCVVVGPGIGTDGQACRIMEYVWKHCAAPLIVDADGLNIVSEHGTWMDGTAAPERTVWFTPHMGELSRLTKKSIKCCKEEMITTVKEYAGKHGVIMVGKDARTVVGSPAGDVYINTSGNNGMATGGSGDVLAGVLAGLAAQGMSGMEAACMAVYLHGLAGDSASARKTAYSMMAGDLLEELPQVLTKGGIVR